MTGDPRELIKAAVILREQAPQSWEIFVRALTQYAASVAHDLVRAEPEMLMKAQGMAVMANELAMAMLNASQLFEKYRAAEEQARAKRMRGEHVGGSWTG